MRNAVRNGADYKFKTDCPFCGKEQHFYFNTKTRRAICFKCMDHSIPLTDDLLKEEAPSPLSIGQMIESANKLFTPMTYNTLAIDLDKFSEKMDRDKHPVSYRYATIDRGFTDSEIQKYEIRAGKSYTENDRIIRKWSGRIVFPFYDNGIPIYAVGRTCIGADNKYVNVDVPKAGIVYGIDTVTDGECILCEGIISAIAASKVANKPAVSVLGKTIADIQAYRIRQKASKVWLSLDGGLPGRIIKAAIRMLLRSGLEVWLVSLPDPDIPGQEKMGDPDDLGYRYIEYFNMSEKVSYV